LGLLDQFAVQIGKGTGTKLFRPHRDVRFSKDKTPYHTHLHLLWTLPGTGPVGFFFGISPDYVSIGGGIMGLRGADLDRWRTTVSGPSGTEISKLLLEYSENGLRFDDPELKRVPAPYDKDHPQGELLKRKSMTVWRDLPDDAFATPLAALSETSAPLDPLLRCLQPPS